MKNLWSKKLSAFLLTLVMVIGMVPAALAVDCAEGADSWDENWTKVDDATHQRRCLVSGCNKVQTAKHTFPNTYATDASSHWKECSACGAQTTHEGHNFDPTLQKDASSHWEQCRVCGYRANEGGHIDKDLNGKCDTCGYDMGSAYVSVTFKNGSSTYKTQDNVVKGKAPNNPGTPSKTASGKTYTFKGWTTSNPGSSALYNGQSYLSSSAVASTVLTSSTTYYALYTVSGSSLSYTVKAGGTVSFDRSDFKELFDDAYSDDTFRYVTFDADSSLKSSNGVLYHNYEKSDVESFTKSDLDDYDFYYKSDDYLISNLTFVADSGADGKTVTLEFTLHGRNESLDGTLEIEIGRSSSSKKGDLTYEVDPDEKVEFSRSDFRELFEDKYSSDTFRYVTFTADSSLTTSNGILYHDYKGDDQEKFTKSDLDDYDFYYKSDDYLISKLTFVAAKGADGETVTLEFTLHGDSKSMDGTLVIEIGNVSSSSKKGDIDYTVKPGDEVEFDRSDFNDYFKEEYSNTLRYVIFTPDSSYKSSNGVLYYDYDGKHEEEFSKTTLSKQKFYYSSDTYGDYPLDDLTFVADDDFDDTVTLDFRAYYDENKYVDGTVTIRSETTANGASAGDIRYYTTYSSSVQLSHNDFVRFFKAQYPTSTLQYVKFTGVPTSGSLIYDAYGASKYGTSKIRLTADNCKDYSFYFSPDSTRDYALSELTFTPNGFNYCPSISFTAYGSGSRSVSGTVLISVTLDSVPDVYGVTPKGTAVYFPSSAISSAVTKGTGLSLDSIRLLSLPSATAGVLYVGTGTTKANTTDRYYTSTGTQKISQLRFVPASGYTGSVELPYVAYNASGNVVAGGKFCLGVLKSVPSFSDVTAATWCYKYVAEMSDAQVIDGYQDGSFRPNATVTYGQALKLLMLASGYSVQTPTGSHWASGYLSRAKSDGLISGTVNLDAPITRLAMAQVAAKALKLSTSDLSSVKPFTDTSDVYVQALSAAGIVEGYFSGGTSTFKPGATLTRGQVAAIVWRMKQYSK